MTIHFVRFFSLNRPFLSSPKWKITGEIDALLKAFGNNNIAMNMVPIFNFCNCNCIFYSYFDCICSFFLSLCFYKPLQARIITRNTFTLPTVNDYLTYIQASISQSCYFCFYVLIQPIASYTPFYSIVKVNYYWGKYTKPIQYYIWNTHLEMFVVKLQRR